ncbi:hypothetical protein H2203_008652, partial [Taxawa tesnikishii (nom. ined.)]
PSEDPNDPLNWPKWKKELIIIILCLGALLNAGTNGPFLNASYFPMSQQLGLPITDVVLVSGYNLLAAGCIGPFICALSRKYGKRPIYLVSTLFDIIGTAIGESKISYEYLLAARIVQGLSTSAFESLIVATVGDIYFVHERGLRISVINFILNAASSLASIICGQVFASLGWLWLFHLFQIFLVIQFVLMFLVSPLAYDKRLFGKKLTARQFCPETTYLRDVRYETDMTQDEKLEELAHIEEAHQKGIEEKQEGQAVAQAAYTVPPKKSFVQELAVFTGVYHHDWIFKDIFGPFLTLLNPAACYAVIASGILNSWYVGSAIIQSGIFSGPPWNFNAAQVGYLGAGPFLGGMIGSIFTAVASDPIIKWMGKKNNGPEFRLVLMSFAAVFCGIGMFLFGYTLSIGANAILCAFLQGMMMVGVLIGIFSTISYGLDAFRNLSSEMFIMNMLFKNFLFYGLSNFANPWVEDSGPRYVNSRLWDTPETRLVLTVSIRQIMYVFGGTSLFFCFLAIPFYIFGKRLRSWWARHDLFK